MKKKILWIPVFVLNGKPNEFYKFNGIILGMKFLSLFNYTIFDYENHRLEFYSDRCQTINNGNIIKKFIYYISYCS